MKDEQAERIKESYSLMMEEWEETGVSPTFSEWEDIFEDRDPFEFL